VVTMYSVCSIGEFVKESWSFFLAVVFVILLCVFFPGMVTFIPNLILGKMNTMKIR